MKYILPVIILFASVIASAQTPTLYNTWSPQFAGSMAHFILSEHYVIVSIPGKGLLKSFPDFMSVPSQEEHSNPTAVVKNTGIPTEKLDTALLLKVVYDSAKTKGRLFVQQLHKPEDMILAFTFNLKGNGEAEFGFAPGCFDLEHMGKGKALTLKEVERATRPSVKRKKNDFTDALFYGFSNFTFKFYDKARTAEFAKMKDPLLMPKQEVLALMNSLGDRLSAALQSLPSDTTSMMDPLSGMSYMAPIVKNAIAITENLFLVHGYNPLGIASMMERFKRDSDLITSAEAMGKKIEESVPALREAKKRREQRKAEWEKGAYKDSMMTATMEKQTVTDSVAYTSERDKVFARAAKDERAFRKETSPSEVPPPTPAPPPPPVPAPTPMSSKYSKSTDGSSAIPTPEPKRMKAVAPQAWHTDLKEALAEAKRTGKNVFIDFTGYTCTNARAMESSVFKNLRVVQLFENYVLVRLYMDDGSPKNIENAALEKDRFKTMAEPYYAILSSDDKELATFPGYTRDQEAFIAFLTPHAKANPVTDNLKSEVVPPPPSASAPSAAEPSKDEFVEVTAEPKALQNIQAMISYPEKARIAGLEGKVMFSALIGADGKVLKVDIDHTDYPVFNQAVVDAVMKTTFKPAMMQDKPVKVWYTQTVSFKLQQDTQPETDSH